MDKKFRQKPFGLLFEEEAQGSVWVIQPQYDEDMDLSYVNASNGHRIPFVDVMPSFISTETATKIWTEGTDTDPESDRPRSNIYLGTDTFTEVDGEITDSDPEDDNTSRTYLSTNTGTSVIHETTDTDLDDDNARIICLTTDTETFVINETTDKD